MPERPSRLAPHPLWTVVASAENRPPRPRTGPSADHALDCSPSRCATPPSGAGSAARCRPRQASPRAGLRHLLPELAVRRRSPPPGLLTSDHRRRLASTPSHCRSPRRSPPPLPGSPIVDKPRRPRSHSTGTATVVPRTNCCRATTSHHASTDPPRRSSSGENHGSGTPKMESPPFPPSDSGFGSSSRLRNLGPGEAAAPSGVGWPPWPCPLARRGQGRLMRLAQINQVQQLTLGPTSSSRPRSNQIAGLVLSRPTSTFGGQGAG
jgi:hypothetical protein